MPISGQQKLNLSKSIEVPVNSHNKYTQLKNGVIKPKCAGFSVSSAGGIEKHPQPILKP